jgi:hypothetical protein
MRDLTPQRAGSMMLTVEPNLCLLRRYVVRVQAADDYGGWSSQGVVLLVRKAGDTASKAACCRSTALIVAQQLGRPIDPTTFRPAWINASASAVGWESSYLQGPEDLEAERLFDYTVLAPLDAGAGLH